MAHANKYDIMTVQALEALDTHQYQAVTLADGKVANNGAEANGILINKPKINEHASVAYQGISKFRAGGAISANADMTVVLSGNLLTAINAVFTVDSATAGANVSATNSGASVVGIALAAVTSGSIGTGLFDFANKPNKLA